MKRRSRHRSRGIIVVAFGIGIISANFFPLELLVSLSAIALVLMGIALIKC